ncbi:MAG: THUMP domain-containing protein, partial [Thermoplasmata archaeon]
AVRARRTGSHPYSSMQLAAIVGEKILEASKGLELKVDLTHPDLEIFVEVRDNRAFVFSEIIPGPGGLPLRSQGRVLSIIEDKKSLLAAWLMMRRGCSTILLNQSDLSTRDIELLKPWNPWWNGFIDSTDPLGILRLKNCRGLVFGWSLEEFESREKMQAGVPVFYPLIGMTEEEINERMARLFS